MKVDGTFYIIWCTDFYGPAIGLAKTTDFKTFVRLENPFIPYNRNGVLFPRKINNKFKILSRARTTDILRSGIYSSAKVPTSFIGDAIAM